MTEPSTAASAGLAAIVTSWLPWVGGGVALALAGGILAASGVLVPAAAATTSAIPRSTDGFDCPGGSTVVEFQANERVLVLARTDDAAYLGVRSPDDRATLVWVAAGDVAVDDSGPIEALPVSGCLEPLVTVAAEQPVPETAPEPVPDASTPGQPPPPPPPPPVNNPPAVTSLTISANAYCNQPVTVTAVAVDDGGVAGVTLTWSGTANGSVAMNGSGSNWSATITPTCSASGPISYTATARDAANQTGSKSVATTISFFG